jgi:hypothetical protein
MNTQFDFLQELNALLTEYAGSLRAARSSPLDEAGLKERYLQVYDLQSKVANRLHLLIESESFDTALPSFYSTSQMDVLLHGLKDAIQRTPVEAVVDRFFEANLDKFYMILGPNEGFPDDTPVPAPKPQVRED